MAKEAKRIPIAVITANEPWTAYELADGTRIQYRNNLLEFERTDQYDHEGKPVYLFKAVSPQMIVTVPDGLKKKSVTAI